MQRGSRHRGTSALPVPTTKKPRPRPAGDAPPGQEDQLPPRVRRVLRLLLLGRSEKETAKELRLRPHTVHSYVKVLYKRLGVSSRGELMARWVRDSRGPG